MICSCLAAEGERSKWAGTDNEPCCDWPGPSIAWLSGQPFSAASGLLTGEAWPAGEAWPVGEAAIGWRAEGCLGDAARWPFGE